MKAVKNVDMPMASSAHARAWIREQRIGDGSKLVVTGEDLVMPTSETLARKTSDPAIFLSVLANPLYWKGTRIAQLAGSYQMYRPLKFEVKYVPQVPVTYSGNVIYGTLFEDGRSDDSLQQALVSSNGGGVAPCYERAHSIVRLNKQFLPQQNYRLQGNAADPQVTPFRWVATYSGSDPSGLSTSAPGWICVSWKFEFSNGTGTGDTSVTSTYTTPTEARDELLQRLRNSSGVEAFTLPLFGTVLGLLKTAGYQLLRNIAVMILENTPASSGAEASSFGAGMMLSVVPPNRSATAPSDDPVTTVRDLAGNEWTLEDTTPVVIYQQGPTIIDGLAPLSVKRFGVSTIDMDYSEADGTEHTYGLVYMGLDGQGMPNWQWKGGEESVNIAYYTTSNPPEFQISVAVASAAGTSPLRFSFILKDTAGVQRKLFDASLSSPVTAPARNALVETAFAVFDTEKVFYNAGVKPGSVV